MAKLRPLGDKILVKRLEADLSARVGAESLAHTRATLQALIDTNPTKEPS